MIFEADSLGTRSRFSSVESSSFKVQLKCHLLCKDSSNPRSKINHPPLCSHSTADTSRIVLSHWTPIYVFTSLSPANGNFSRQVPCHSAFVSLCLEQCCVCSRCSINDDGQVTEFDLVQWTLPEHLVGASVVLNPFCSRGMQLVFTTNHEISSVVLHFTSGETEA